MGSFNRLNPGCCCGPTCLPCPFDALPAVDMAISYSYFDPATSTIVPTSATFPLTRASGTDTDLHLSGVPGAPRAGGGAVWRSGCFYLSDPAGNHLYNSDFLAEFFCDALTGTAGWLIYQMAVGGPYDPPCLYAPTNFTAATKTGWNVYGPDGHMGTPFGWNRVADATGYPRYTLTTGSVDCDPLHLPYLGVNNATGSPLPVAASVVISEPPP